MIYDLGGHRVGLTDATIRVIGERMMGATDLKLKETLEPGDVEGASAIPVGFTTGPWSGTGGFKAPLAEALRLVARAGPSYGLLEWSATWTFTALESSDGINTIEIPRFRVTSPDLDGGDRSKHASIAFEMKLLEPAYWNGVRIIDPPEAGGFTDFALSIFGG